MLKIALHEPEIPPNTGNIMRLCANIGYELHLIKPLGFTLEAKQLRRASMDYRDMANVTLHKHYAAFIDSIKPARLLALTTKGSSDLFDIDFAINDVLLFGSETRGLPDEILDTLPKKQKVRIPMQANSRSINLSNSVAIVAYEAYRQIR